jgi:hypothetical protein
VASIRQELSLPIDASKERRDPSFCCHDLSITRPGERTIAARQSKGHPSMRAWRANKIKQLAVCGGTSPAAGERANRQMFA